MANSTLKKSLILLVLTLVFSFTAFSQKMKLKEFSNDFSTYLSDLDGFMTNSQNDELKSVFKKFSNNAESFSEMERDNIIHISNKMLSKRLRPNPHFSKFLSTVVSVKNSKKGDSFLLEWLRVFKESVEASSTNKLMLFCAFTSNLVSENILRSSKSAEWRVSDTEFYFDFEMFEPIVVFPLSFDLSCSSNDGLYTIYGTKGTYHFVSTEWFGEDGLINWEHSKDSIFFFFL